MHDKLKSTLSILIPDILAKTYASSVIDSMVQKYGFEDILFRKDVAEYIKNNERLFTKLSEKYPEITLFNPDFGTLEPEQIADLVNKLETRRDFTTILNNYSNIKLALPGFDFASLITTNESKEQLYKFAFEKFSKDDFSILEDSGLKDILLNNTDLIKRNIPKLDKANLENIFRNRDATEILLNVARINEGVPANMLDSLTTLYNNRDLISSASGATFQNYLESISIVSGLSANYLIKSENVDYLLNNNLDDLNGKELLANTFRKNRDSDASADMLRIYANNLTSSNHKELAMIALTEGAGRYAAAYDVLDPHKLLNSGLPTEFYETARISLSEKVINSSTSTKLEGNYKNEIQNKMMNAKMALSLIDIETLDVLNSIGIKDANDDKIIDGNEIVTALSSASDYRDNTKLKEDLLKAGKKLAEAAKSYGGYPPINMQELENTDVGNLSLVTRFVNELIFDGKGFDKGK